MVAASSNSTVTITAAFLQEIEEANQEMWDSLGQLESMCSRPISLKSHCFEFVGRLSDLRDHLALHFALEEAYGHQDEPAFVTAELAEWRGCLRKQHRALFRELDALVEQAESLLCEHKLATLTTVIPVKFDQFAKRLCRHEAEQSQLLREAWLRHPSVGD